MVAEKTFPLWGGFEVAGAGVYLPASEIAFDNSVWDTVEEYGNMLNLSVAVLFYLFLGSCKLCNVLNSGVPLLLCKLTGLVIWVLINLNVVRSIGRLLDAGCLS